MSTRALPVVIVALATVLVTILFLRSGPNRPAAPGAGTRAGDRAADGLVGASERARARRPAERAEWGTSEAGAGAGAFDLVAALRAIGELSGVTDSRLPSHLRPLLVEPEYGRRTLALLRDRRLAGHPWTPAARGGAAVLLTFAIAVYDDPPADGELAGLGVDVDGRAFTLALLADLHAFDASVRARVVELVRTVRVDGRLVLDTSYLDAVLQLRAEHPEARATYGELLLLMAEELGPGDRAALHTLFLSETDDATLMKVALSNLLRSDDGTHYVNLARSLLEEGALADDVRAELLHAVATSAPVDDAASMLAEHAGMADLGQATTVGLRPGGAEALGTEYTRLVVSGSDPAARRLLVAGLTHADPGTLLGIACTDPDAGVRGQALASASLGAGTPPAGALVQLESGWGERGDPHAGISAADATTAAANLARRTSGSERERALDVLREVVREPGTGRGERRRALEALERHVTDDEHAALARELEDR